MAKIHIVDDDVEFSSNLAAVLEKHGHSVTASSEATFSRAFDAFAQDVLPQRIHEALIKTHYGDKIAGHVSRDATAIHAREKAATKPKKTGEPKPKRRGRRRRTSQLPPARRTRRTPRESARPG